MEKLMIRNFVDTDAAALEQVIRETWNYDRFSPPQTAQRLARVYPVSYTHLDVYKRQVGAVSAQGQVEGAVQNKVDRFELLVCNHVVHGFTDALCAGGM